MIHRFYKTIKTKITVYFNLEQGIINMSLNFIEDDKYVSHWWYSAVKQPEPGNLIVHIWSRYYLVIIQIITLLTYSLFAISEELVHYFWIMVVLLLYRDVWSPIERLAVSLGSSELHSLVTYIIIFMLGQ